MAEYLQIKTPFIERWEKEMLLAHRQQFADFLNLSAGTLNGGTSVPTDAEKTASADAVAAAKAAVAAAVPTTALEAAHVAATAAQVAADVLNAKKRKLLDTLTSTAHAPLALSQEPPLKSAAVPVEPEQVALTVGETGQRKVQHNAVEKRRRDRINCSIEELRELLPNCRHSGNKAAVLIRATEEIRRLQRQAVELQEQNRSLLQANQQLFAELADLHRVCWSIHPAASAAAASASAAGITAQYQPITLPFTLMPAVPVVATPAMTQAAMMTPNQHPKN